MDRWIALNPLYTLSLTSFLALYKWKFSNTQQHLAVTLPNTAVWLRVLIEKGPEMKLGSDVEQEKCSWGVQFWGFKLVSTSNLSDFAVHYASSCCISMFVHASGTHVLPFGQTTALPCRLLYERGVMSLFRAFPTLRLRGWFESHFPFCSLTRHYRRKFMKHTSRGASFHRQRDDVKWTVKTSDLMEKYA